MGFFDFLTEEIAIDLGTANTLIIHNDKVVIDSPSIVARDRVSGKIIAVGKEANLMQGKTHENIKTIRPLKDGVIAFLPWYDKNCCSIVWSQSKESAEYYRDCDSEEFSLKLEKIFYNYLFVIEIKT